MRDRLIETVVAFFNAGEEWTEEERVAIAERILNRPVVLRGQLGNEDNRLELHEGSYLWRWLIRNGQELPPVEARGRLAGGTYESSDTPA